MKVGNPGEVTNLFKHLPIFLDRDHMRSGVPHRGGLPGWPGRVTSLAGASFLHVQASEWGNPPSRGNQI